MTIALHPPMPFFEKLIEEHGTFYVYDHYFDEDMEVLPDAPEKLKREVEALRSPDSWPGCASSNS